MQDISKTDVSGNKISKNRRTCLTFREKVRKRGASSFNTVGFKRLYIIRIVEIPVQEAARVGGQGGQLRPHVVAKLLLVYIRQTIDQFVDILLTSR